MNARAIKKEILKKDPNAQVKVSCSLPDGHLNIYKNGKRTATSLFWTSFCGKEKWAAKGTGIQST